jgi:DNA-directed RNA polymerase specialized sigma24 family protein
MIRQSAAGEDDTPTVHLARYRSRLVRSASRALRRLVIDEAELDGEGAVDLAFVKLCQAGERGKVPRLMHSEEFLKLMTIFTRRVISDEKKRSGASKRGGTPGNRGGKVVGREATGAYPDSSPERRRTETDLDQIVSPEPPVDVVVAAKLDSEALLALLTSDLHRTVFKLRDDGHSIESMASFLGVDRSTVERKLRDNERLFRKWADQS